MHSDGHCLLLTGTVVPKSLALTGVCKAMVQIELALPQAEWNGHRNGRIIDGIFYPYLTIHNRPCRILYVGVKSPTPVVIAVLTDEGYEEVYDLTHDFKICEHDSSAFMAEYTNN